MRTRTDGPNVGLSKNLLCQYANHSEKPDGFGGWERYAETDDPVSSIETGAYNYRLCHDVVTPGFVSRRARGEIINSPYDAYYEERNSVDLEILLGLEYNNYPAPNTTRKFFKTVDGHLSTTELGMTDSEGVILHSLSGFSDNQVSALQAESITNAWAKVSSAPMQIWATLGELNETVDTVRRLAHGIWSAFTAGKRQIPAKTLLRWRKEGGLGNPLTWLTIKREAESFWLLLRYGIRPMIYDFLNALRALERLGQKTRTRFGDNLSDAVSSTEIRQCLLGHGVTIDVHVRYAQTVRVSSGVLVQPMFETENLITVLGTGSFVVAAWELVPFSFVIDWFSNVGKILASWVPSVTIVPLTSWVVIRKETTIEGSVPQGGLFAPDNYNGWPLVQGSSAYSLGHAFQYIKTTERIPRPSRSVVPNLFVRLNAMKGIDLFALFSEIRLP